MQTPAVAQPVIEPPGQVAVAFSRARPAELPSSSMQQPRMMQSTNSPEQASPSRLTPLALQPSKVQRVALIMHGPSLVTIFGEVSQSSAVSPLPVKWQSSVTRLVPANVWMPAEISSRSAVSLQFTSVAEPHAMSPSGAYRQPSAMPCGGAQTFEAHARVVHVELKKLLSLEAASSEDDALVADQRHTRRKIERSEQRRAFVNVVDLLVARLGDDLVLRPWQHRPRWSRTCAAP